MIVYFSNWSGFTHQFVEKLEVPASRIPIKAEEAGTFTISEPYVLILPSYGANGIGFVPKQVIKFLNIESNRTPMVGVIGTGNRNFLGNYCKAAQIVSEKCGVPVLHNLELSGTMEDVELVKKIMRNLDGKLQH